MRQNASLCGNGLKHCEKRRQCCKQHFFLFQQYSWPSCIQISIFKPDLFHNFKMLSISIILLLGKRVNSLPNDKILDEAKLKEFADDKIKSMKLIWLGRKYCGKRRKCWLPLFSPFPTMFSNGFFLGFIKSLDCVVELSRLTSDLRMLSLFCSFSLSASISCFICCFSISVDGDRELSLCDRHGNNSIDFILPLQLLIVSCRQFWQLNLP